MTITQAINVLLSFKKADFVPFRCFQNMTLTINTETQDVKTIGDGIWGKQRPTINRYSISFSGINVIADDTFFGWADLVQNQIGWVDVEFLLSFRDDDGVIKSFSGFGTIQKSAFTAQVGEVVPGQFDITGNGLLKFFDGLVPCDTSVTNVSSSNLTDPDGNLTFDVTYTGAVYQVKYRLDGVGAYGYALMSGSPGSFTIAGVPIGPHSLEVIPICANNYEGTGFTYSFTATRGLTCSLQITSITNSVSGNVVTWTLNYNADPSTATLRYRIDGGAWINYPSALANPMNIIIGSLSVGSHLIEAVPVCANGADGTGNSNTATVTSSPTTSIVNWQSIFVPGGTPTINIWQNGLLVVNSSASASGSITVNVGDTIKALVKVTMAGRDMSLRVQDVDLGTDLYNDSQITGAGTTTDQYLWTANGDTYSVKAVVSP